MASPQTIHATTIVLGEAGILIRGDAGSGKSTLARKLIGDACARRLFARLVADDRSRIEERHGRLLARGVEAVVGPDRDPGHRPRTAGGRAGRGGAADCRSLG